jgi:glyoxalase family protein
MTTPVRGIHHVTCIAGDAQQNVDFYVGVMGLRLVKRSVNQDAPDTWHLFYADNVGTPGTDLTFFPWPAMPPAASGIGLAMQVSFAIPVGSLDWWRDRLAKAGTNVEPEETRFGERAFEFRDPHGLTVSLVETIRPRAFVPWEEGPVPAQHQLRGMDSVRLWQRDLEECASFLTAVLGFEHLGSEGEWHRYTIDAGQSGTMVDIREMPEAARGRWGTGGIHHVAWRVADEQEQTAIRESVQAAGRRPTEFIDRFWFTSVYFREPGGVLFELATDGPGFGRDEAMEKLGESLILPPWLEPHREEIEKELPPIRVR